MAFLKTPDDYAALGVDPPSSDQHEPGTDPLNNHIHHWKQYGTELRCEMGSHPHGHNIPATHILTGTDDRGRPEFKVIDISTTI